jgi:HlyD family secretion protein
MNARVKRVVPVVLVLGVVAVLVWKARNRNADADLLLASGTVEATQADLGFLAAGRIAAIAPREGDDVGAGAELATLEKSELESALEAARAQLSAAEARLRELQAGSRPEEIRSAQAGLTAAVARQEEAQAEAARSERLYQGGAMSRQAFDRAQTALSQATATRVQAEQALALAREGPRAETVSAQRALVEQARANFQRGQAALEQTIIHAPFGGRVTVRHREPGEVVPPGAPVITLLDPADRWVRIYVPENRVGRVSIGQPAEVRAGTFPDRVYKGEVVFVGDVAEFTPRNVQTAEERTRLVYPVKVRVTGDPDFDLKPGVPADVLLLETASAEAAP